MSIISILLLIVGMVGFVTAVVFYQLGDKMKAVIIGIVAIAIIAVACMIPSSSSGSTSSSSFTNKYGTSTTKCVVSGCDSYIAKSGNTNCCPSHSNRCGNCNCYIDGDALFCMDCIEDYLD